MGQDDLLPRLKQDLVDLHHGGIIVVAWMVDEEGYVLLSKDTVLIRHRRNGRERTEQVCWEDLVLEHYRVYDGRVTMALKTGGAADNRWDIALDSNRGGMDALAFILGHVRG